MLNTWKRATGDNYITCKVKQVKKAKLSRVDNKLGKGMDANKFFYF